ncbi:MAG: ATP-binding cassette domain-containing protein [Ferruginibacter sp.]|nr:ATP-binding cassette domain-containing protein [Ferruginibacter sp.]
MIQILNLSKSFGNSEVLKNIELSFSAGNVYGIVGENGAGKTTLFNCIAGLEKFDGQIKYSKGILKNVLGFLPTDSYFFSKITGGEYLQLLCNARNVELTNTSEKNIFDLPLNQFAETYSTGMKKKLAITAILLQQNKVFVLDEPFNGVDIQSNILIKAVILKLKSLNKIVIISSHIFSTLKETCDELHLLKNGVIIKSVLPNNFSLIEEELKDINFINKINNLGLI